MSYDGQYFSMVSPDGYALLKFKNDGIVKQMNSESLFTKKNGE